MEMFLAITGLGLLIAVVTIALIVRRKRRQAATLNALNAILREARLEAEKQARAAAKQEARQRAEVEARRAAEEQARVAAEQEARQRAEVEARRAAEEQARAAAEQEARQRAEVEARRAAEEQARAAAEQEARQRAEVEARRAAEEQARAAAEQEARQRAEVEVRRAAEEQTRVVAEQAARERAAQEQPNSAINAGAQGEAPRDVDSRRARQYRPPVPSEPAPSSAASTSRARDVEPATRQQRTIPVELRVLFERGGYCSVSLLLKRLNGLPEACALVTATGSIDILALSDEWYQDIIPEHFGKLLRSGFVWTDPSTQQQWQLTGREIYVLATGTTHRGFVSAERFVLGREHLVICTSSRLSDVEKVLQQAGCTTWKKFGEDDGVPDGWVVLGDADSSGRIRGIVPIDPVPLDTSADILNVLRPLPELEIALERGIPLGYNLWLASNPPEIRIYGDRRHIQRVLIDGHESTISPENAYTAPGWNNTGSHQIWCNGATKTYSLISSEPSRQPWAAYSFPLPYDVRSSDRITICGPLVLGIIGAEPLPRTSNWKETFNVPPDNPVLIGATPGEVIVIRGRTDIRGAECVVSPRFSPVWALPAEPLRCDKNKSRIFFFGRLINPDTNASDEYEISAVTLWWRMILAASHKGLSVEPPDSAAVQLWDLYRRHARALWRKVR